MGYYLLNSLPVTNFLKTSLLWIARFFWVILLACDPEKTVEEPVSPEEKQEQERIEAYQAEVNLGRSMAGRLLQFYGTYGEEQVVRYINTVGNYVASFSDFPERRYMFSVLDTEQVNAFACPGGYILITKGALRQAQNEAELAAILGHEIAHVGKKHMFNTLAQMDEKSREKEAKEVESKTKVDEISEVRRRPEVTENSETAKKLIKYLGGSKSALSILKAAKAGMNLILEKGLAPQLEYEADDLGVRYAVNAGYAPKAMVNFFSRMEQKMRDEGLDVTQLSKTHPSVLTRKTKVLAIISHPDFQGIVGAKGNDRFDETIALLGDGPEPKKKTKKKYKKKYRKKKKRSKGKQASIKKESP